MARGPFAPRDRHDRTAAGTAADGVAPPDEASPGADDLVAAWVARAISLYPRPTHPVAHEWDASVQGLVRTIPYVPRVATRPLGLLDRFGAVTVGPSQVGLDGADVDWDRVVEIRTEPAWTSLSAEALEVNLAQYLTFLPPVPGRGWVVRKLGELLFSLYLAVLPPDLDAPNPSPGAPDAPHDPDAPETAPEPWGAPHDLLRVRAVTQILYHRRFGQGETRASATSVLLQLALPESTDVILRTAADRGVPVVHVAVDETRIGSVAARGAQWRATALALRERIARRA
ncbi:hypothetical protein V5D56_01780 [Cellulosimicrobium sp. PMB13]|uniref:hypothetical protein n=1 Tax=Cellulosimicrobium sp. PMB13 TaxID=3120158 RepID=UPI003F4B5D4D